ncbi:PREDICTED: uncharacterized protein LOC106806013 [Priapulus caudatus]|uniref:Uncharacterized protein LOC106806013 n=1 Tax=Priapulus caudatus TaxID=37621 RepID=A0ABM1DTQ4_PRICU|nr:PREDICTED: uncharacterized protein LOC106806013 [Priapulus caudatus]
MLTSSCYMMNENNGTTVARTETLMAENTGEQQTVTFVDPDTGRLRHAIVLGSDENREQYIVEGERDDAADGAGEHLLVCEGGVQCAPSERRVGVREMRTEVESPTDDDQGHMVIVQDSDGQQYQLSGTGNNKEMFVVGEDGDHQMFVVGDDNKHVVFNGDDGEQFVTERVIEKTNSSDGTSNGQRYLVGTNNEKITLESSEDPRVLVNSSNGQRVLLNSTDGQHVIFNGVEGQRFLVRDRNGQRVFVSESSDNDTDGEQHQVVLSEGEQHQVVLSKGEQHQVVLSEGEQHQVVLDDSEQQQSFVDEESGKRVVLNGNGGAAVIIEDEDGKQYATQVMVNESGEQYILLGQSEGASDADETNRVAREQTDAAVPRGAEAVGFDVAMATTTQTAPGGGGRFVLDPAIRDEIRDHVGRDLVVVEEEGEDRDGMTYVIVEETHETKQRTMRDSAKFKVKPYRCGLCQKEFACKTNCLNHLQTHVVPGGRPYKCERCGQAFGDLPALTRHLSSHDGTSLENNKERPYKCGLCGRVFSFAGSFTSHMRVHSLQDTSAAARNAAAVAADVVVATAL